MQQKKFSCEYEQRTIKIAQYIVKTGATVRQCAKKFNLSKSCIHKDICIRLEKTNPALFALTRQVLDKNKAERHVRGGIATKKMYEQKKENNVKPKQSNVISD